MTATFQNYLRNVDALLSCANIGVAPRQVRLSWTQRVARTVSNVRLTIALFSFQKIVPLSKWYSFDSYSTMTDFDANN